ncbi:hypothetical protein K503DRAFT_801458 [Rhizopogon vinicolor AM-OR11-026]|uniref:Uncharacterized protein n=1 Tax=Rhizopogon vinicolor AM-OR11-026 TaxID=1314800 RepID=A0A1B7MX16_9AGAM|nr:hypothetical protein K503DRAFT_801458 [Rhizopogon vinicolor AM-OR11-026]
MVDFPVSGIYRIRFGSYTATILDGENWELQCVNQGSTVTCIMKDLEGQGYLGIKYRAGNQAVERLPDPQSWILRQTDEGITIGQIWQGSIEYFWSLRLDDDKAIRFDRESMGWVFERAPY